MRIQKTFKNELPTIYMVGTPIGNLDDVSKRVIDTLTQVNAIYCEDTRTSSIMLDKIGVKNKLVSLHKFNELERLDQLKQEIEQHNNIAIIADAGVPGISDPGALIVCELLKLDLGFNVTAINAGPAYIHAIISSGFVAKNNYFLGFLDKKHEDKNIKDIIDVLEDKHTIISFYESVHRIITTIDKLCSLLGDEHEITISRELTKIHEEIIRGSINEVKEYLHSDQFTEKGEFVVVLKNGFKKSEKVTISEEELIDIIEDHKKDGLKLKQILNILEEKYIFDKKEMYSKFNK